MALIWTFIKICILGLIHHNDKSKPFYEYYTDGVVKKVTYFANGNIHRMDGPAVIGYDVDGVLNKRIYIIDNLIHSVDGPAIVYYCKNGITIRSKYYYLDGVEVTEKQWLADSRTLNN